ncbi:MAG TPA: hypothetical protein VES73_01785 [Lamprocystis sp. (in: g-proteobacteria)]|nr:hypothetical protein [Lamprocystis sp. (in: g-proteobacteria)]
MMHDAGNRQMRPDYPAPLTVGSLFAWIGTLGVPATLLSFGSLLAFAIILLSVQYSPRLRSLYRLPVLPAGWLWLAVAVAAALAWVIVIVASRRPGPWWPRLWALALALAASVLALGTLAGPAWLPTPQWHALVTATVAGVVALAPRLARVHPDSAWALLIAPVSLLTTLLLFLPLALIHSGRGLPATTEARGARVPVGVAGAAPVIGVPWSGAWSATQSPDRSGQGLADDLWPGALLHESLFTLDGRDYPANQIPRLWGIDLATARRLQPGGHNDCGGGAFDQPGQEYRIDCYAQTPDPAGRRTGPAAEVRIVYSAQAGPLTGPASPSELWYGFALGPAVSKADQDRRKRETMRAFFDAVTDGPGTAVGGSDADLAGRGFTLKHQGQTWKVQPPIITRHHADREWVVIRVVTG